MNVDDATEEEMAEWRRQQIVEGVMCLVVAVGWTAFFVWAFWMGTE